MMGVVLGVFVQHAKRHWPYVLLMLFALITAGSGLSSVLVINQAALASLTPAQGPAYQIIAKPRQAITIAHYGRLRQQGVIDAVAVAYSEVAINQQVIDVYGVDTWALLNNRLQLGTEYESLNTVGTGRAWISHSAAKKLELRPGAKLTFANGKQTPPLAIGKGMPSLLPELSDYALVMPITDFFTLLANDANQPLQAIFVLSKRNPLQLQQLTEQLPTELTLQATTLPIDSQTMGKSFSFHLVAMAGLLTVVSLFIVTNALTMLLAFRHKTIAHLHKLGIAKKHITQALCFELALYCIVGSLVGVLLGFWLITNFASGITTSLSNLLRAPFSLSSVSFYSVGLLCLVLCALGMAVAVILPLKQALQTQTHTTPKLLASRFIVLVVLFGLIFIVGLLQFKTKEADLAALALFILLGSVVITMTLPNSLSRMASHINKRWALFHWSLASASKLSGRCKLAASSYFIALVSAIGLSGMVDSFRTATEQWLHNRLAAPAYVYTAKPEQIPSSDNLTVETRRIAQGRLNNVSLQLTEIPTTKKYQQSITFTKVSNDVWALFTSGQGILINQQFAYRHKLTVGDVQQLTLGGKNRMVTVVGVYQDFGNPLGQGLLAPSVFSQADKAVITLASAAALQPKANDMDWPSYQTLLAEQLPDASFITKPDLIAVSMAVFDQTFVLTDGLTVVALVVAAFSFAITIALLSQHLQGNIQALSALGIPFKAIRRAVFNQFLLICLLVSLLAVPFGIALAYLLITTVNINAFGWTYPLNLSFFKILVIVSAGFMGMLLVCWFALRRSSGHRLPPGFSTMAGLALVVVSGFLQGCSAKDDSQPLFAGLSQSPEDTAYKTVNPKRPISLPEDHAAHPQYQLEWWYLTSVLEDKNRNLYPFQYTLFRFNQNGQQTYMAHASLHSASQHWFEQRFAQQGLPYVTTQAKPFLLAVDDWLWQGAPTGAPFPAELTLAFWQGPAINITVKPYGPYVLHGKNGVSVKSADSQHVSYYYSHPYLQVDAQLQVNGEQLELTGNGWYDHEWTSQLVDEKVNGWDWFAIHLQSGDKIMAFRLRIKNKPDFITGSYITAAGKLTTLQQSEFTLTPNDNTGVPLRWQLSIPAKNFNLAITPIKTAQWNCGLFSYYEGGVKVTGSQKGKGFMELTGYPHSDGGC